MLASNDPESCPAFVLLDREQRLGTAMHRDGFICMANPRDIAATARPGRRVVGWKLAAKDRGALLQRFVPTFAHTVADHVTLSAKVSAETPLPDALPAAVVGYASDQTGVEALVVAIDGSTERPDGSHYHITWSLGAGRRAKESNDVIARLGWRTLEKPVPLTLVPALLG